MTNQIHLGSGLNLHKLTDVIGEIEAETESTNSTLVCIHPQNDDAWMRLTLKQVHQGRHRAGVWVLAVGCHECTQLVSILHSKLGQSKYVDSLEIVEGIFVELRVATPIQAKNLAKLIILVASEVQQIQLDDINLILEQKSRNKRN